MSFVLHCKIFVENSHCMKLCWAAHMNVYMNHGSEEPVVSCIAVGGVMVDIFDNSESKL